MWMCLRVGTGNSISHKAREIAFSSSCRRRQLVPLILRDTQSNVAQIHRACRMACISKGTLTGNGGNDEIEGVGDGICGWVVLLCG